MSFYEITINSTAADKAEASRQLSAAKAEWNAFLQSKKRTIDISGTPTVIYDSGNPNVGWSQVAEPKLNEILQRYPYVTAAQQAKLVSDTLAIRGDGTYVVPGINANSDVIPIIQIPNTDDGYPLINGTPGLTPPNLSGTSAFDANSIKKTKSSVGPGSSATDAPSIANTPTRPATVPPGPGNKLREDRAPTSDPAYPAQENQVPITGISDSQQDAAPTAVTTATGQTVYVPPPPSPGSTTRPPAKTTDDDKGSVTGKVKGKAVSNSNSPQVSFAKVPSSGRANQTEMPERVKIRENLLHRYVNWTYKIGWYMLDIETYNSFVTNGQDTPSLRARPLCVSGGFSRSNSSGSTGGASLTGFSASGSDNGMRNDLYIKSLRCNGVIGNNKSSPNANLFEIEMQVVEPYSVSMLAELKRIADNMGGDQQHFQVPYLLEIKFLGYDDKGAPIANIPGTGPKLIPVNIINITFNITSAGTVYTITMVPTGQTAINAYYGVIRNNVRVYGKTLEDLLVKGNLSLAQAINDEEKAAKAAGDCEYEDEYKFVIKSFNGGTANDELLKSPITFPIGDKQSSTESTLAYLRGLQDPNPLEQSVHIPGGSNIKDVVQRIAMMTKYFQDKVKPESPNSQKNEPMQLIKVIPLIEYGKFDRIRQRYKRTTTFKITTYLKYGQNNPYTGQAKADQGVIAKEYNWLFTGKNSDIIDLDLQFNLQYFRIFEKASPSKSNAETGAVTKNNKKPATSNKSPGQTIMALPSVSGETSQTILRGAKDAAVQEYFDQQLNSPTNADLISLDMTIIGDPDWIPQDLSIRPKGPLIRIKQDGFENGSIVTDVESVFAALRFKTPRDYSDTTGLMELTNNQTQIEGIYQVITVESNFENGRFTQKLQMVRLPEQDENKPRAVSPGEREPSDPPANRQTRAVLDPAVNTANNRNRNLRDD